MKNKKVGIIGVGNVGSTLAYTLATKGICEEIVLKDIRENIVKAMALDISQASHSVSNKTDVYAARDASDLKDCDIIVITAGIPRKTGMSRDDLLLTNAKIMQHVIEDIKEYAPNSILIIVSNPLDAMVYSALKSSGFKKNKVIGMAGILDSSRMKHFIYEKLNSNTKKINASVMGGHGDNMVPLPNHSTVDGVALNKIFSNEEIEDIVEKTKHAGAQIVKYLETGSAYYAPAHSTLLMIEAILNDTKDTYPCAVLLEGEYGYQDVVSGVPVMLGKNGIEKVIEIELSQEQKKLFSHSIASVKDMIDTLNNKFFKTLY